METRSKITIAVAIIIAILPFLGFPGTFRDVAIIILGLGLAGFVYWMEKRVPHCEDCMPEHYSQKESSGQKAEHTSHALHKRERSSEDRNEAFVENAQQGESKMHMPADGMAQENELGDTEDTKPEN